MSATEQSFFGIDLSLADSKVLINCGGPITPEIIEEAYQRIVNTPPPIPCGMPGNAHILVPRPIGKYTYCVQCGHPAKSTKKGYRNLTRTENNQVVRAMMKASRKILNTPTIVPEGHECGPEDDDEPEVTDGE